MLAQLVVRQGVQMQDMKMHDLKMTDHTAWQENGPSLSCHVTWSIIFSSCIFNLPNDLDGPSFLGRAFSVNPSLVRKTATAMSIFQVNLG